MSYQGPGLVFFPDEPLNGLDRGMFMAVGVGGFGTYEQLWKDAPQHPSNPTWDALVRGVQMAETPVNALAIGTGVVTGGVTLYGLAAGGLAGTELVTIGGRSGFNLLSNQALNRAIGLLQRTLLRRLFLERQLPPGLTKRSLELYREIAKRAITEGKDQLGVQAERLKLIEQALRQLR